MQLPIVFSKSILALAILTFAFSIMSSTPQANAQTTWYVDDNAPNDPGPGDPTISDPNEDGSPAHPFDAIQEAVNSSTSGDTIELANGTYTGDGNKNLDFGGRAITVRSTSGDPNRCVIDCEHYGRGFCFSSGEGDDSVVRDLTITNGCADVGTPTTYVTGGAVCCFNNSNPKLDNCLILGNSAWLGGGIACHQDSNPTVRRCILRDNRAGSYGGAIYCHNCGPLIERCGIIENKSAGTGGAIGCLRSSPMVINCRIANNVSSSSGAGLYCNESSPIIINCTIIGNVAPDDRRCGGLHCYNSSDPQLINCIVRDNSPGQLYAAFGCTMSVKYSNIQNGWSGTGNIDADPRFSFTDDHHLMHDSPCIDSGTNALGIDVAAFDADGNPRPLDGDGNGIATADMGPYEFDPTAPTLSIDHTDVIFTVAREGGDPESQLLSIRNSGGGNLSWEITGQPEWLDVSPASGLSAGEIEHVTFSADTENLLQDTYTCVLEVSDPQAINTPRQVPVTLHFATELQVPSEYGTIQAAIDAAFPGDEIVLASGTYTGEGNKNLDYRGKPITVRSASGQPETCIIDCEGDGRGFYLHSLEGDDSVIKDLTIANGYSDAGGGIYCECSSPTITNCVLDGSESPEGGGIYCRDHSNPAVINCSIIGNIANDDFFDGKGGAILCWDYSCPTFANCLIHGNSSDDRGSVFYCGWYSRPTLINCTVSGNTCPSGSTIGCESNCETVILNSIIWGNSNDDGSDESAQIACDDLTIQYSCVQGWTGTLGGEGNFGDDPAFIDPDGPDNISGNEDDDLRLTINSPCIDAGDNGVVPTDSADLDGDGDTDERTPFDLDAYPRFVDDPDTPDQGIADPPHYMNVVDIGAYEFNGDMSSTGACCLPCACIVAAHSACLDAGGTFLGAGTDCSNYECPIIDPADFDVDGDVDLDDFAVFQQRFAGPN